MSEGSPRKCLDRVPLWLSGEFVSVPRDDEKVLRVYPDDLPIVPPERRNGIQEDRERVHAEFPKLLIPVLVSLFQSDDFRKLGVWFIRS
jgi:hypothetical protein